jgi:dihydropteroate synthase
VADGHIVSVDTWKPAVARAAVEAGASIVNDTGGLADPVMRSVVAGSGAAAVLVHVEAANPHAVDVVAIDDDKSRLVAAGFESRLAELEAEGIRDVIVDPGIAINYRGDYESYTRQQLEVIMSSSELRRLGRPVLIPIPRKRDIHRVAAYIALALEHRADIIRVHDVAIACDLARLFQRLPG